MQERADALTLREIIPRPLLNPLHIDPEDKKRPDDFIFRDGKFRSKEFRGITRGLKVNLLGEDWRRQLKHSKHRKNYYPIIGKLQYDYSEENMRRTIRSVK